jgi:glycosyltransferase involved in cell wall biosynthesis
MCRYVDGRQMTGIWVTWEIQRRNLGLSSAFGFPLLQIVIPGNRIKRYLISSIKTWHEVRKSKPDILVVQNPSIILALLGVFIAKYHSCNLIVDAHNSGIFPAEGRNYFLMLISKWLQQKAKYTIVTNKELQRVVLANGGNSLVLPDKIPHPPAMIKPVDLGNKFSLLFICSFSEDEPYREVFTAARGLGDIVSIYVTGKFAGKISSEEVPENVKLLGFVSDSDYWSYIYSCDAVLDLTLRENCLVCGAYEGTSLGKPMILSDTLVLRDYFNKGCVYVDPTENSIKNGIIKIVSEYSTLKKDAVVLKSEIESKWQEAFNSCKELIVSTQ